MLNVKSSLIRPSATFSLLLVIGEKYYNWWYATVDGKKAEIVPVDHILRTYPGSIRIVLTKLPIIVELSGSRFLPGWYVGFVRSGKAVFMHEAVGRMLAKYERRGIDDTFQALREIIQEIALLGLWRSRFFEHAAFYGGTARGKI